MEQKKILLKLGGRKHLGEYRWEGALEFFDEVHCTCLYREHVVSIENEKVFFYEIKHNLINQRMSGLLERTKHHKSMNLISWCAIFVLRIANRKLIKSVKNLNAKNVLCSYGDYDRSDFNCLVFKEAVKAPIVRAYKESRLGYNFLEYHALKMSDIHVFYAPELKTFLEKKYGKRLFDKKKVLVGYDENALPSCILRNITYRGKLSSSDGRVHVAILSFRVDSAPNRDRDQNRYYYIDVIKKMIEAGLVVHLHCQQYNNLDGVNKYEELMKEYSGWFYMEPALEMKRDSSKEEWIESCEILSQYDAGLLHNIIEGSSVSEFDKINVPHRFFAYEAAHVTPIIQRGENVVLERIFEEKHCGFTYDTFSDLSKILDEEIDYFTPSYEDYLKAIFEL